MGSVKDGARTLNQKESSRPLSLPDAFLGFLDENGLDPSIYSRADSIPRYIRIKSGGESHILHLEEEIKRKAEKVGWLPGFFSIPPNVQIASSDAYRQGKIYGMDAASGAAVLALNVAPGDHVLDLCAAPGAKLCMLSDILGDSGSITGVDVARHRLAACRTMLQKYALEDRCRLFVADGTLFSLLPLRSHQDLKSSGEFRKECLGTAACNGTSDVFKEWTHKRTWKERKANKARNKADSHVLSVAVEPELIFYGKHSGVIGLRRSELYQTEGDIKASDSGYDKVLVDAECTHDGSFKHIQKFEHWGWETFQRRVMDAQRTDTLTQLQVIALQSVIICNAQAAFHEDILLVLLANANSNHATVASIHEIVNIIIEFYSVPAVTEWNISDLIYELQLLTNGFRLLKTGGSLIYSTCSLTVAQNEGVVEQFLSRYPSAELQEIIEAKNWPCQGGWMPKTLRFDPLTSQTSGLFIAKFTKVPS